MFCAISILQSNLTILLFLLEIRQKACALSYYEHWTKIWRHASGKKTKFGAENASIIRSPASEQRARVQAQVAEHRRLFTERMTLRLASQTGQQQSFLSEEKYHSIVQTLQLWESIPIHDRRNFPEVYRYARKYFLMTRNGGHNELFSKKANEHGTYSSMVHLGNIFDCIQNAHNNVNHSKGKTLQSLLRERHGKTIPMWIT